MDALYGFWEQNTHTAPKVPHRRLLINYKGEKKASVKWRNLAVQTSDQSQTPTTMGQNGFLM